MAIVSTFPEKKGLNTDDINDIASGEISNGFVQSQTCYSTEEQVIGKWINGKPLYQKTIELKTPSSGSDWVRVVALGITHYIVEVKGFYLYNGNRCFPITALYIPSSNDGLLVEFNANGSSPELGSICMHAPRSETQNKDCVLTIQYYKTTD